MRQKPCFRTIWGVQDVIEEDFMRSGNMAKKKSLHLFISPRFLDHGVWTIFLIFSLFFNLLLILISLIFDCWVSFWDSTFYIGDAPGGYMYCSIQSAPGNMHFGHPCPIWIYFRLLLVSWKMAWIKIMHIHSSSEDYGVMSHECLIDWISQHLELRMAYPWSGAHVLLA